MLDALIVLFAFYGLTYVVKESSIFSRIRNWIMMKFSFIAQLLYCWFCTGFHCGWVIYLLHEPQPWHFNAFLLWALAGSAVSGLFNALFNHLTIFKTN